MDYDQIGLVSTDSVRMLGQSMWIWPPKMGWPDDPNAEHQHRNDEYLHWRSKKYPINIKKNMTTSHVILYVFCYPSVFFLFQGWSLGRRPFLSICNLLRTTTALRHRSHRWSKLGDCGKSRKTWRKWASMGPFESKTCSYHHLFIIFSQSFPDFFWDFTNKWSHLHGFSPVFSTPSKGLKMVNNSGNMSSWSPSPWGWKRPPLSPLAPAKRSGEIEMLDLERTSGNL